MKSISHYCSSTPLSPLTACTLVKSEKPHNQARTPSPTTAAKEAALGVEYPDAALLVVWALLAELVLLAELLLEFPEEPPFAELEAPDEVAVGAVLVALALLAEVAELTADAAAVGL